MPWLVHRGPPAAHRALGSGALLQATARIVWSKVGSGGGSPRAAAGAPPFLGGQLQAVPGGGEARAAPHKRQHRPSFRQGCSWLALGDLRLQSPLRLLPAAAVLAPADPSRPAGCRAARAGYLPPHKGFGYKQQVQEDAEFSHLQPQITLQATASNFPSSGSSGKDTSRSPEKEVTDPSDEDEKKPNKSQQLKKVFKEYGAVGVSFHIGISLMSLGIFYLAVSSGVDMTAVLLKLGFNEALVQSKVAAGTSTFVLAYAIHKAFAPVRISITLVSVPFLVRYFRKIGFFKPPASNP
ncbi:alpha-(1,3)-fucosyltransferase 11 [Platysternon megacephalum]|uniref:Alpha-(1,3)-fucosyltransferase 11 n=1 Tax=Platysternon megacephalum TaxID=55544 RepID=A0A4D9E9B1_9SAUR|nr:alpha-(1,3)-fucosyltransferase 11 [Platysternon megacephalum]